MITPGSNLLDVALELIEPQTIKWRKFISRSTNRAGIFINAYDLDVDIEASVQAVSKDVYKECNLDWQKDYRQVYTSHDISAIDRDFSGDRFIINGQLYQVTSDVPWYNIDGWDAFVVVRIKELS